jgi:hypothetical protein
MVTLALANARPWWRTSTSTSSGAAGDAPRAKTVWSDFTCLSGTVEAAATRAWARSWPPKTTPWPSSSDVAVHRPASSGTKSSTAKRSAASVIA